MLKTLLRRQRQGPAAAARRHATSRCRARARAIRAQEKFYKEAVEAVHAAQQPTLRFQPLAKPKE